MFTFTVTEDNSTKLAMYSNKREYYLSHFNACNESTFAAIKLRFFKVELSICVGLHYPVCIHFSLSPYKWFSNHLMKLKTAIQRELTTTVAVGHSKPCHDCSITNLLLPCKVAPPTVHSSTSMKKSICRDKTLLNWLHRACFELFKPAYSINYWPLGAKCMIQH